MPWPVLPRQNPRTIAPSRVSSRIPQVPYSYGASKSENGAVSERHQDDLLDK